jgi:Protein of unknown function (DUF3228)
MFLVPQSAALSFATPTTGTRTFLKVLHRQAFTVQKSFQPPPVRSIRRRTITRAAMSDSNVAQSDVFKPSAPTKSKKNIVVDPFCYRQFREYYQDEAATNEAKDYTGTIFDVSISEFERIVNERYSSDDMLKDGYAPFCKHLFIVNDFTNAVVNVLPITHENEHLLRTKYVARNDKELPVLIRYFPKAKDVTSTTEQSTTTETAPWGIVSIKAQDIDTELPMTPITNMRNALGKEYGGSGIPLDYDKYMECINYWKDHATIS